MSAQSFTIEPAQDAHRAAMMALLQQANMHHIPSPEMPALSFENYFVALATGKVIGLAGYKILSATEAKTELMVVDNAYRGHGVGYQLQAKRMADMFRKGIRTLTTNADLPQTIRWYKKHFGYEQVGRLGKLHEFGDPAIDEWVTLRTDLVRWHEQQPNPGENE